MKILLVFTLFAIILSPVLFEESEALRQVAGKIIVDIKPGQSDTFQWGLASDEANKITTVVFSAEGDGSEFLSFQETLDIDPKKFEYITVTVSIPADYPGGITLEPFLFATEYGEEGSATQLNIRMLKIPTLNIAPNDDSSLWVDWEKIKPTPEEVAEEKPIPEQSEETKPTDDKDKGMTIISDKKEDNGGGCLIATAAYGSELSPQIQFLREIRDNTVMSTASGTAFMNSFNQFYYSFSPTIADLERENPAFKEIVKVAITPLVSSLSLLSMVEINSDSEMLTYGVGIIALNIGMYVGIPVGIVFSLRNRVLLKKFSF